MDDLHKALGFFIMLHVIWSVCSCIVSGRSIFINHNQCCSDNLQIYLQIAIFLIGLLNGVMTAAGIIYLAYHVQLVEDYPLPPPIVPLIPPPPPPPQRRIERYHETDQEPVYEHIDIVHLNNPPVSAPTRPPRSGYIELAQISSPPPPAPTRTTPTTTR